jgi:hypothetical protein
MPLVILVPYYGTSVTQVNKKLVINHLVPQGRLELPVSDLRGPCITVMLLRRVMAGGLDTLPPIYGPSGNMVIWELALSDHALPHHRVGWGLEQGEAGRTRSLELSPNPHDLRHHTIFQVSAFRAHKTLTTTLLIPRKDFRGWLRHPVPSGMPYKHSDKAAGEWRE